MLGRQSVVVKPLHEELEEMGLDAEKVKRDILENSRGMPMASVNPQALTEDNAVVTEPTDDVDAFDDDDFDVEESEETDDEFPEIDEDFEEDDDEIEEDDDEDGEELDEAFKVQKMRRLTSGEKAKAKKARKKRKGKRKAYAKKYYARMKKKIAKRRKKLLKKYGKKGLEKLHKQRKRLVAGIDRLATLREELEGAGAPGTTVTPVEEAAINAGWLALLLGEIFESLGDADVAEMLEAISDSAASLSEELEGMTEDELSEDQQNSLRQIFEAVAKALEAHEDLGSPSLMEAIEYGIENGLMEDEDEDEEDDELDEDEELEDESPFDELGEEDVSDKKVKVLADAFERFSRALEKHPEEGKALVAHLAKLVKRLDKFSMTPDVRDAVHGALKVLKNSIKNGKIPPAQAKHSAGNIRASMESFRERGFI